MIIELYGAIWRLIVCLFGCSSFCIKNAEKKKYRLPKLILTKLVIIDYVVSYILARTVFILSHGHKLIDGPTDQRTNGQTKPLIELCVRD